MSKEELDALKRVAETMKAMREEERKYQERLAQMIQRAMMSLEQPLLR